MPIDYSKWNSLELSDDSDVEIHPNIEKGTFIRLRQQKIRQDRETRAHTLKALESEIIMNKQLVERIQTIKQEISLESLEDFAKRMLEWSAKAKEQEAIIKQVQESMLAGEEIRQLSRDEMVDTLIFRVQEELATSDIKTYSPEQIKSKAVEILGNHIEKLKNREPEALTKMEEIKKEQRLHVSVDDIAKEGFNRTIINKSTSSKAPSRKTVQTTELLNPEFEKNVPSAPASALAQQQSGDLKNSGNDDDEGENDLEMDSDSRKFAMVSSLDQTRDFIQENFGIISSAKSDQILAHAFELQMEGKHDLAKQFVRQSLIITYILQMGSSGISLFFSKIATQGSPGNVMFYTDVEKRYKHIVERCKILKKEREDNQVEGIQLQTDGPNNSIKIYVPDRFNPEEADKVAIFDQLPKDFQDALTIGTLDALNESLAKVTGKKAEEILAICGEGGFLVIDEEIMVESEN